MAHQVIIGTIVLCRWGFELIFLQHGLQNTTSSIDEPVADLIESEIGLVGEHGFFFFCWIRVLFVFGEPIT